MGPIRPTIALVLVLGLAGCGGSRPSPNASPEPLRVAAASDLRNALPKLIERFTRASGVPVTASFGSSGQLAEQIRNGAPFDVFLAANRKFVADLAADGTIRPDSVRPYALGTLVLAVHPDAAEAVAELNDLAGPSVKKIAIANPATAPYGAAAKQALERSGLWDRLSPKLVQAESVGQALQFVETGNAEAGFAGHATAKVSRVRVVAIDPSRYDPIVQALGVVARAKRPEDAGAFARFVLGAEGQAILAGFGFRPPPDAQ